MQFVPHCVRRIIPYLFLSLAILSLAAPESPVEGQSVQVGVRIPAGAAAGWLREAVPGEIVIDYGTFTWTVMPVSDLAALDRAGVDYQQTPNPYTLTLGGESFDPLVRQPNFSPDLGTLPGEGGEGLHLVQFFGPTKAAWLDALEASGLEVVQYIHPFTYVVWGEGAAVESQIQRDFVRWTGVYLPAYAIQPEYRLQGSQPSQVRVLVHPKASLAETVAAIEALGGTVTGAQSGLDPVFDLIACTLPGDRLASVAALPGVYSVQPVPTDGGIRGEMSNQVIAGNLDGDLRAYPGYLAWLSQLGLSGQGVVIANVDNGVDQGHPDLINRMLPCIGLTCGNERVGAHGTHTAGIMAGDGASGVIDSFGFLRGLGVAPGAGLVEQLYSPTFRSAGGMLTLMTESSRNQAVISGNSWGPSGTPQGYDADTRWVDIGVRDADPDLPGNQPLTYVVSVMNGNGGTSTQGTPDEAKNIFSVGSTYMQYPDGSQNLNINNLSENSAHGPALDGRNLPLLVAPGCAVDSTYYPGSGYYTRCGTSMAAPHLSGAAALFFEQYRARFGTDPSPALVKAAFLPVAHSLAGHLDADGAVMGHPFDSKQGWGRLNLDAVLNPPGQVLYIDQAFVFTETGQTWSTDITLYTAVESLRMMLVWTDAPGHGLGGDTPAWVNDLDLSVAAAGQTYFGNVFGPDGLSIKDGAPDGRNNTEGVFLGLMPSGTYTITVTAANISGDGVPGNGMALDQDFALVVYYGQQVQYNFIYEYIYPLFYR